MIVQSRIVALTFASFLLSACAARSSTAPGGAGGGGSTATPTAVLVDAEEARYYERANRLRERVLERASWMESESLTCDSGILRLFSTDSVSAARDSVTRDVNLLERLIIARGIDNALDEPREHELLRTVLAWEADVKRPNWDVQRKSATRMAIAAGLSGKFLNPETRKCESFAPLDTVYAVLPGITNFAPPKVSGVTLILGYGEDGLNRMRDGFYARTGNSPNSVLNYVRVRAAVVWRDFAVVAVNRPVESRGAVALPQGRGGAAYIFHHVNGEWRLLTITRTWG